MSLPGFVDRGERPDHESPFDGADFVLYSADAEWAEQEPNHEALDELGLVSWSLWARFEDDGVEIPIVGEASWHIWYSLSPETWNPDPAEPVSEAFARAIVQAVDEDVADGWGGIEDELWESLSDLEGYVVNLTLQGFLSGGAAEPALVIDWCHRNAPGGEAA